MDVDREKITQRAYQIWEQEGRPDGKADYHWWRATRELDQQAGVPSSTGEDEDNGTGPMMPAGSHRTRKSLPSCHEARGFMPRDLRQSRSLDAERFGGSALDKDLNTSAGDSHGQGKQAVGW